MEQHPTESAAVWGLGYYGWAAIFMVAMGCAAMANIFGIVSGWVRLAIMFAPLVLVPPMWIAQMRMLGKRGYASPALMRYSRRLAAAGFAYMVAFLTVVHVFDRYEPGVGPTIALALLAVAPAMAMIVVMIRYLAEETDEYLRHRAACAALFGLAVVLALGTFWGFLETFGLLPGVWAWWVFPVWAAGLGVGHLWMAARAR